MLQLIFFKIIYHLEIDLAYDKPGDKDCAAVKLQQAKLKVLPESKNDCVPSSKFGVITESAVEHQEPLVFENEDSMDSMHTKSSITHGKFCKLFSVICSFC